MRIDAHQHFWNFDPVRHAWINETMLAIQKDFLPADLNKVLKENQFDGCVTVQVDQTPSETDNLIAWAKAHPFIKGVVGWVDLKARDLEVQLSKLSLNTELKGFRHIAQGQPSGFFRQKDFLRGIGMLAKFGFTYDILIYENQLQEAIELVRQFPKQKFILDHIAKPMIKDRIANPWRKYIAELSLFENVFCKISGMVTEADWRQWNPVDFAPYLDAVFAGFGTQRVCYGSDWPVCLVAASYEQQLGIVEGYINRLSEGEKTAIMGENSVQFYNL